MSLMLVAAVTLFSARLAFADSSPDLLTKAMQASMAEVQLGKIAQKNAESTGVSALGARLERDHARIGKILANIARGRGVAVPVSLDPGNQALIDSLGAKSGAEFDTAYTAQMVSDQQKAIALYTAAAQSGDSDLGQLAQLALPTLREDAKLAGSFQKLSASYLQTVAHNAQTVARR